MEQYLKIKSDIYMAIKKKNNNSLSSASNKRSELLIKVDDLMEKLNNEYGPFLLDELQKRLETTINEFHTDLKMIFEDSFKNHKNKSNKISENTSDVPSFIADYEEKIKNK